MVGDSAVLGKNRRDQKIFRSCIGCALIDVQRSFLGLSSCNCQLRLANTGGTHQSRSQRQVLRINGQPASQQLIQNFALSISEIVSLRSLTIGDASTNISDAGFADFWRLSNLDELSLGGPAISGSGLAVLAELPKLRRLSLSPGELHAPAAVHIARCEHLIELRIGTWQGGGPQGFTDEALMKLAESPSLKKLSLHRERTQISDQAIETLRKLKPELKIDVH